MEVHPANSYLPHQFVSSTTNTRDDRSDPDGIGEYVGKMHDQFGVAYVHAADTNGWSGQPDLPRIIERMRRVFSGAMMINGAISLEAAETPILDGDADLVAFARAYIAIPDRVERIATDAPAVPRQTGWHGGDATGYLDYPFESSAGQTAPITAAQA